MSNNLVDHIVPFLLEEIGLKESSVELGIKISYRNNISLPIALWSYGLINTEELDRIYRYIWN
tara:strand:- start:726 stop:914 length:189 start_codon:yes stop_codon:yes gene_type:complete